MKYRKKPIVIEAVQYNPQTRDFWPWVAKNAPDANTISTKTDGRIKWVEIKTLEGVMKAESGDWIIKGIAGELYPCKPAIFAATYEQEAN
ncbi:hypothetical protein LCGC14_1477030 [marine sediment metagenome]|uniref:Uncharacterized protein n=1 Tax=marine sediment metagenome TaxID=412755 RepID=A0A0F9LR65_9ZZZZ